MLLFKQEVRDIAEAMLWLVLGIQFVANGADTFRVQSSPRDGPGPQWSLVGRRLLGDCREEGPALGPWQTLLSPIQG